MRHNLFLMGVLLALGATVASAQTGVRILGAQQVVLDDNVGADPKIYLTNSTGSMGIDNFGVVSPGTFPSPCALLDLSSTTKGFLPPRMTALQEAAICGGAPPLGLMVFNTTTNTLDIFGALGWGSAGWALNGNTLTGGTPSTPAQFFGSNNNYDIVMKSNGSERMRIASTGNIFMGTTAGFGFLNVNHPSTSTIGGVLQDNEFPVSPAAAAAGQYDALGTNVQYNSSNAMGGSLLGAFATVQSAPGSTGTINQMVGLIGNVGNYSAAAITRADAVYAQIQSQNTGGSMTDATNFRAISFISGTQTVTNLRGLYINNPFAGGSITNNYGIDIDQLSAGTNNTAFRYNHSSQPVTISGAGDMQIGGTPSIFTPIPGLLVTRTNTSTTGGAKIAAEVQMIAQPTAASSGQFIGLYSHIDPVNSNALNQSIYGVWGGAEIGASSAAPINMARGMISELVYGSSQPLTDGAAHNATIDVSGAGNASSLSVYRATFQNPGPSTINDLRMINVLDLFSNNGTINNTYGLYIGSMTLGTQTNKPFSIFASDASARSFIDGHTGFGSAFGAASDPQSAVDIAGSLSIRYDNFGYAFPGAGAFVLNSSPAEGYDFLTSTVAAGAQIAGINGGVNGRILIFHITPGGFPIVFSNENGGAAATARIHCMSGANVTVTGEAVVTMIYEGGGGLNRWLIKSISQF